MATISANGGAERYWRNSTGARLVLCRNGKLLVQLHGTAKWKVSELPRADLAWREDTTPAASAAVTRTTRQAGRRR